MHKIITEETIRQACSSRISKIREEGNSLLKTVEEDTVKIEEQFVGAIESAGFSSNAFVPFCKMDFSADARFLPDGLYVGMLKHPSSGKNFLPAILPFTESNATGFCVDPTCDLQMTDLMQMLAMRVLLSVPVEQVKCHFIDLYGYEKSAKHFNRLSDKVKEGAVISDKRTLSEFVTNLEDKVRQLNRNVLLDCSSLREYNSNPSHIAIPYHFIFFSHIHHQVDREILSRITSLCDGKNASTCGIFFFYTIDRNAVGQQKDIFDELLNMSTIVLYDEIGAHFSNSIYGQDFEERYTIELDKSLPDNLSQIIKEINHRSDNIKPQIVSFDQMLEDKIASGDYWKGNTSEGISIPIGRKGANDLVNFTLGGKTADYFAMIGGRPGYGKTVLLHDIICYGSIIYSPQELELYLIDCTNGTGFKPYENLPHARFVSITKQREYTDSAIDYLVNEMFRRADLFKTAGERTGEAIEKIERYRSVTNDVLPRILVIIDEFQVLLEKKDKLSNKISKSLEKIIREGRKYGISIIFCTQSYRNIDFDTELITLRIAFNLKEMDSLKVLGTGNDSAAHLTKKGEAIFNNKNGEKDANVVFQAAFTDKMRRYVDFCAEQWSKFDGVKPKRFVFDGKTVSNLGSNSYFIESLSEMDINQDHLITYIGVPMFIRENHSYFTFRKAIASNLLICGTDITGALTSMALINYQLSQTMENNDVKESLFIADYFSESSDATCYLRTFAQLSGIQYLQKKELEPTIDRIEAILKKRIDDDMSGIEEEHSLIVGTVAYIQNAPDMRKNQFNQASKLSAKIQNILKNGPDYGIHLIVYAYNYKGLSDVLDTSFISSFGNRVILQGGAIGPQLIQEAETLAKGNALLITEDESTTYEQDPIIVYNEFYSDILQDDVLDFIFSICNKK